MGTNCAPHIANIYLHVYENEYVEKLIENNDLKTLEKLKDIFRFQDDLFSVNDDGIFENILSTMYPSGGGGGLTQKCRTCMGWGGVFGTQNTK